MIAYSGLIPAAMLQSTLGGWIASQGVFGNLINLSIVALFVFGCIRYLKPLRATSRAFVAATEKLNARAKEQLKEGAPGTSAPVRAVFPAQPSHLNELWSDFLRTRSGATVHVGDVELSTIDPEGVFSEQAVLEGYNRSLAVTLAGVFTGLGILGTFIGLVTGMAGLQTGDAAKIGEGASQLIDGMSAAFYTSIFGIVFSLAWLLLDRTITHEVQRNVGRFFLKVREIYPVESADRLLHRLLEVEEEESKTIKRIQLVLQGHAPLGEKHPGIPQLYAAAKSHHQVSAEGNEILNEQKAILQSLGTDLAVAFQTAMDNSLSNTLKPALETIAQTIGNYSAQADERQAESLREMVKCFQEQLAEQLGGQFQGLADSLQSTSEWQTRVHGELGALVEQIQRSATMQSQVLERSTAACDLFTSSLGQLGEMHQQIQQTSQQMAAGTSAVLSRLEAISANVERVAAELDACVRSVGEQTSALATRIESLDAQQETYQKANESIRIQLAKQLDALSAQVEGLTGFWLRYKDDLSAVGEQLRGSVAEFGTFTAEKLGEVFARFDSEMARVVEHLSGTLAEVREVTDDLPGGVERLRDALQGSVGAVAAAGATISEFSRNLRTLEDLPGAVRSLSPLPEHVATATARVLSTEQAITGLDQRIQGTDERLARVVVLLEQRAAQSSGGPTKVAVPEIVRESGH